MGYMLLIIAMFCIYLVLSESLNLTMGYGGMLSLAHAVFFGVGAYGYALFTLMVANSFLGGVSAAVVTASILGFLFAVFCVRLRSDEFLLATIALQMLFSTVARNWISVTGGPFGLSGITRPTVAAIDFGDSSRLVFLLVGLTMVALLIVGVCTRSRLFLDVRAVRDDWEAAMTTGVAPIRVRVAAFTISAGLAATAGAMYAVWFGFVDVSAFVIAESISIFIILAVGGLSTFSGPFCGALLLVLLPELLRFSPLPDAYEANVRQVLYGIALVLVTTLRPKGLVGAYSLE